MSSVRDQELGELFGALEYARDLSATVPFLIYGEAGVGKTTLLRSFAQKLTSDVVAAFASFGERTNLVPLQPIADLVELLANRLVATTDPLTAKVEMIMGSGDSEGAEQVLQVLGLRPWVAESHDIFWALRRFFASCGDAGPIVLLLDDVHRADAYSLEFLTYLGVRYAGDLLIVSAAEPSLSSEMAPGVSWRSLLLQDFTYDQSRQLAENFLPGALSTSELEVIARASRGRPLVVVEALSLLLDPDPQGPPPGVEQVVRLMEEGAPALVGARLDRLDESTQRIASLLAVADQPLSPDDIEALAESKRVAPELDTLIRRSILDLGVAGTYRFRHALIREVAYEGLSRDERVSLHLKMADHAARLAGSRDAEFSALHLEKAANEAALTHAHHAAVLQDRAAALHVPLAEALLDRSDPILAEPHFRTALTLSRDAGMRSRARLGLVQSLLEYGHYAEALALVDDALAEQGNHSAVRDRLLIARYLLHAVGNLPLDLAAADRVLGDLTRARREDGDHEGEAYGHDARAYIRFLALDGAGLTESWRACLEIAEREGIGYLAARSMFQLVQAYAYGPTPVDEGLSSALAIVDRAPSVRVRGAALMSLAALYAMEGSLEEAETAFERAAEIFFEVNVPYSLGIGACGIYLMTDDPTPALDYLRGDYFRYRGRAYDWLRSRVCGAMALVLWELDQRQDAIDAAKEARPRRRLGRYLREKTLTQNCSGARSSRKQRPSSETSLRPRGRRKSCWGFWRTATSFRSDRR